jgi:hypothetical protein
MVNAGLEAHPSAATARMDDVSLDGDVVDVGIDVE